MLRQTEDTEFMIYGTEVWRYDIWPRLGIASELGYNPTTFFKYWVWDVVDLFGLLPKLLAAQVRQFMEVGSGYHPWLGGSLFLGVN
jgi:hypothetical protein